VVPGVLGNDPDGEPILRVGAGKGVEDEEFLALQRGDEIAMEDVPMRLVHRLVDLAPGDVRLARRLTYEEFVVRRAARVLSGAARHRAAGRDESFLTANRLLVQRRTRQVPFHAIGLDPLVLEAQTTGHFDAHQTAPTS